MQSLFWYNVRLLRYSGLQRCQIREVLVYQNTITCMVNFLSLFIWNQYW